MTEGNMAVHAQVEADHWIEQVFESLDVSICRYLDSQVGPDEDVEWNPDWENDLKAIVSGILVTLDHENYDRATVASSFQMGGYLSRFIKDYPEIKSEVNVLIQDVISNRLAAHHSEQDTHLSD